MTYWLHHDEAVQKSGRQGVGKDAHDRFVEDVLGRAAVQTLTDDVPEIQLSNRGPWGAPTLATRPVEVVEAA